MGLSLKVGSALLVTGLTGGGVAVAYSFSGDSKSVRNELKKIGYYVLQDNDTEEKWQKVLDAYKRKPENSKKFNTNVPDLTTLKQKCKSLLDANFDKKTDYSVVKKWCVAEETIDDILSRNGYEKIGASSANGNSEKWESKVFALKRDTTSTNKINVTFDGRTDITLLETACNNLKTNEAKTHSDDKFEEKFIQAREWCAIKKNVN